MPDLIINDLNVHYTDRGSGRVVFLLHGWRQSLESFAPVARNLEAYFRVLSIDFPGFGKSDTPTKSWGMDDYTSLLEGLCAKLEIIEPILIGHSFGGRVSMCFASRNKVNKVVLVDSAGVRPRHSLKYYCKVYAFKAAKSLLKLPPMCFRYDDLLTRLKRRFGSEDYRAASGVMQQTMVRVVNEDLRSRLPSIKAPTLLIWGENDTATPVRDAELIRSLIPDAGLVVLKNAGHFSFLDKLNEFLIIINQFLKEDKA